MAIIDQKKSQVSVGLLGKLKIGTSIYEVKDIVAREAIDVLTSDNTTTGSILKMIKDNASNADFTFTGAQSATTIGVAIQAVQDALDAQKAGSFKVVSALPPTSEAETNVIYLVPKTAPVEDGGKAAPEGTLGYIEWVYVKISTDPETYQYEEIGDTDIDLSGYYTKDEIDTLLADMNTTLIALETILTNALNTEIATREEAIASLDTTISTQLGDWSESSVFEGETIREAIESVYSAIAGQSTDTFVTSVALDSTWDSGSVSTLEMDTTDSELAVFTTGSTATIGGLTIDTALAVIPSAN